MVHAALDRIHSDYAQRRAALEHRFAALEQEQSQLAGLNDVGSAPCAVAVQASPSPALDFTTIPRELDARLEAHDPDGALRPTVIHVGKLWSRRSHRSLLAPATASSLSVAEQKLEKDACWDLLDALTRSGGLPIEGAMLHIVVASTHCFDQSLWDTLVKCNVNPIDKVERSSLIVASVVQGVDAEVLLKVE
jgi:hypothetical protein